MVSPPASGIDWDGLTNARRALIRNPYELEHDVVASGEAWFESHLEAIPAAMRDLCERKLPGDARKLVLAAAHGAARAGSVAKTLPTLERGVEASRPLGLLLEIKDLRRIAWTLQRFNGPMRRLLGASKPMRRLRETLWTSCFGPNLYETLERQAALRQQNILILGEPGTGKELVADVIQAAVLTDSPNPPPAQAINCAAIPAELAEAELFGFEKGAHSKADEKRVGKIAAAHGGTLFLDEVADLPPQLQAKLLSVLANGKLTPLGSNEAREVDVRYVAATSRPLFEMVEKKTFRDDLYSRLGQTVVEVPALRERPEDIVEIGLALFEKLARVRREEGVSTFVAGATPEQRFLEWLRGQMAQRTWHANVRELEAVVREYVLGFRRTTQPQAASPAEVQRANVAARLLLELPDKIVSCAATQSEVSDWYLRRVLEHTNWNLSEAQRVLGVDRGTIRRRAEKLGLTQANTSVGTGKADATGAAEQKGLWSRLRGRS